MASAQTAHNLVGLSQGISSGLDQIQANKARRETANTNEANGRANRTLLRSQANLLDLEYTKKQHIFAKETEAEIYKKTAEHQAMQLEEQNAQLRKVMQLRRDDELVSALDSHKSTGSADLLNKLLKDPDMSKALGGASMIRSVTSNDFTNPNLNQDFIDSLTLSGNQIPSQEWMEDENEGQLMYFNESDNVEDYEQSSIANNKADSDQVASVYGMNSSNSKPKGFFEDKPWIDKDKFIGNHVIVVKDGEEHIVSLSSVKTKTGYFKKKTSAQKRAEIKEWNLERDKDKVLAELRHKNAESAKLESEASQIKGQNATSLEKQRLVNEGSKDTTEITADNKKEVAEITTQNMFEVAKENNASKESIAMLKSASSQLIADLNNRSAENIAEDHNISKEKIQNLQNELGIITALSNERKQESINKTKASSITPVKQTEAQKISRLSELKTKEKTDNLSIEEKTEKYALAYKLEGAKGAEKARVNSAISTLDKKDFLSGNYDKKDSDVKEAMAEIIKSNPQTATEIKDYKNKSKLSLLGNKASKLSMDETGAVDDILLKAEKWYSNEANAGKLSRDAYQQYQATFRHAMIGSQVTPKELEMHRQAYGHLGLSSGAALGGLLTSMEAMQAEMDVMQAKDPYLFEHLIGDKSRDLEEGIKNLKKNILLIEEAEKEVDEEKGTKQSGFSFKGKVKEASDFLKNLRS